jgi:hypothetical protein
MSWVDLSSFYVNRVRTSWDIGNLKTSQNRNFPFAPSVLPIAVINLVSCGGCFKLHYERQKPLPPHWQITERMVSTGKLEYISWTGIRSRCWDHKLWGAYAGWIQTRLTRAWWLSVCRVNIPGPQIFFPTVSFFGTSPEFSFLVLPLTIATLNSSIKMQQKDTEHRWEQWKPLIHEILSQGIEPARQDGT